MKDASLSTVDDPHSQSGVSPDQRAELRSAIQHAVHYLPSQGPITVFVHHNTLHFFENLSFEQAVVRGARCTTASPICPRTGIVRNFVAAESRSTTCDKS